MNTRFFSRSLMTAVALAASASSFAQVTISGQIDLGYAASTNASGTQSSGLGTDNSNVFFGVTEDLGGGMKVAGSMGVKGNRGVVAGLNTSLALSTSAYTVTLASVKDHDWLSNGTANVDAAFALYLLGDGLEDAAGLSSNEDLFNIRQKYDYASIAVPVGPVTLSLKMVEPSAGTAGMGLGVGAAGTSASACLASSGAECQRSNIFGATYTAGALKLDANYATYDQQGTYSMNVQNLVRAAAAYNFGAFKLGGGLSAKKLNSGTVNDYLVSAATSLGALDIGASFGNRAINPSVGASGNYSGYEISAAYNLSKQTNISAQYMNYQASSGIYTGTNSTWTQLVLVKNF